MALNISCDPSKEFHPEMHSILSVISKNSIHQNKHKVRTMSPKLNWLTWTLCAFVLLMTNCVHGQEMVQFSNPVTEAFTSSVASSTTELPGGIIREGQHVLSKAKSPYLIREDLVIDHQGELIIEPGVELRFGPMVGITVRGVLTAIGTQTEQITLTSANEPELGSLNTPTIRLVDGPSILAGRLQIFHRQAWRSVCTNSRNWTRSDLETACRQLGFQGGSFYNWMNRQMPLKPRILYEEPQCSGTENSLLECRWFSRQMGSGVCDYHPDLGIQCLPRHENTMKASRFWRGLRFEHAQSDKMLTLLNTLYVPTSRSEMQYVNIKYGGAGREYNATSALHVEGVPPQMKNIQILYSAYNGINVTSPDSSFKMENCTIRNNRGYGVFINSTYGYAHIDGCLVNENGGDGIKYVHQEERPDEKYNRLDLSDFCTIPTTSSQTYPVQMFADQSQYNTQQKICMKNFNTRYGHVLTMHFKKVITDRNNSALIEIYDGTTANDKLIASFRLRNNTRPQSVTSSYNRLFVKFHADRNTKTIIYLKLASGFLKSYDLNVSTTTVSDNNGRGVAVENLRSQVHIHKSSISNNNHVAGFHVSSGVGYVNVTDSRIAFNEGDGINITYTGGSRNISKTTVSSNKGYGIAVWLNDTAETEYIFFNQTSAVQYSDIFRNLETGILHGNYCGNSYINITGNRFMDSLYTDLEIMSCWKNIDADSGTKLQIGHNIFNATKKLGIKIKPAINIDGKIEYNFFQNGHYGAILIKNEIENRYYEEFNILKANILIHQNQFYSNKGVFVVNLGLSPYSDTQKLLFTRNYIKDNRIREPFESEDGIASKLNPRSRIAAPVVVSSSNVDVFRNILQNGESNYEIGSHLEDQSKILNCTYNWLGSGEESKIFKRLFDRKDRYNLAKIDFLPYLLHNSNPGASTIIEHHTFVPQFNVPGSNLVGGEVEGLETLKPGEYVVERDINVRPGGKLILQAGVTLNFPPSIGIMVAGKLDARGRYPDDIKFTLKQEMILVPENDTYETDTVHYDSETEIVEIESKIPIRLLGGKTSHEGRLQIKINNKWGTVCSYGWTMLDAALVCHQLGLVLNPDDWLLERNQIPNAGLTEDVIVTNVKCDEDDVDITQCKAERLNNFENSCTHELDVGIRCYESSWAGLRLAPIAERSDLQYITIEKAGLLDYSTNSFKPALQIDFAKHSLDSVKVNNNFQDGLGIIYSDIYSADAVNVVKNSEFSNNFGHGISFKQLGMKIQVSSIENNVKAGVRHNPAIRGSQQRELAGWFNIDIPESNYHPMFIPQEQTNIYLDYSETKYLVSSRVVVDSISRTYNIRTDPGYVIGIQLLNPIENRSTENILIYDTHTLRTNSIVWSVNRDLNVFPTTSSSFGIILQYDSGNNSIGGTVLVISSLPAPQQNIRNKIIKGPIPTLTLINSKLKNNNNGIKASFYNRYLDELGNHYLRKSNESIKLINCEISHNNHEAIFVHSPFWDIHESNLSEILFMVNASLITDNGKGIMQFSRDMRSSNNLFHYVLQDNTIERNLDGGFEINLPYVWQYDENFTHSVFMDNNTWRDNANFGIAIDGHFALLNMTKNFFTDNKCKDGLISIRGMEKKMKISHNKIERNSGTHMVQFKADSQCEIIGEVYATFFLNEIKRNGLGVMSGTRGLTGVHQIYVRPPTTVIDFQGIQKVKVVRNLFGENDLDYELVSGIRTARIDNILDVRENWWGSNDIKKIRRKIFDFDDWNNHAVARFNPFLMENAFDSSQSISLETPEPVDIHNLGGRLTEDLTLYKKDTPYIIKSDITVMPGVTLTISPAVVMEFAPNVGILVLGTLKAQGIRDHEIIMRPISNFAEIENNRILRKRQAIKDKSRPFENLEVQENIRLCTGRNCSMVDYHDKINQGFLEYFNSTTLQWIPMCDDRFTERNAQVVCRQLGFDPINAFFDHDIRIEFHSNSLTRIWSWPEPLECKGTETRYEKCPIRLNGQLYGHRHECKWNSKFIFISCGERNLGSEYEYWGGIRIASSEFEQRIYEHRIHDIHTHENVKREESRIEFVNITGAGILHNEKSPAIQSVIKSPSINFVNVTKCASHGINVISPTDNMRILFNNVKNTLGVGINALSLTGEGREATESSFTPLKDLNIPYHIFSLMDICDTTKELIIEERVLIYYKYDNHPVNCVKIIKSSYRLKPIGFRLLQFNLFNSTSTIGKKDSIELYDGDIYNVTSKLLKKIEVDSGDEKILFKTVEPSLSVKLFANGASSKHGFIAEIVTLPISAIGFNRDVQHNISHSELTYNREGGVVYASVGEVNPIITMEKNHFSHNCEKLYGNFSTCTAAIDMDIQNTQTLFFRNNLVKANQGGLSIKADSRGSATSLKGWIHNNLFVQNINHPALYVEGRQSSPYQEVTIYRNYFAQNKAPYQNVIVLKQVVSNFTLNYVHENLGAHILEVSGFDKVRLPIYQTTTHNGFYSNLAVERDSRGTIVAGTAGQHYVDNIFFNPDNDYEMVTVNRSIFNFTSTLDMWKTKIDAAHNYWGYNDSIAVTGRIKDVMDDINLLEVYYEPYYMNNKSVLNGKCPPGWNLVGDTCYMYIGAPMTFNEARDFCRSDNASMPYIMGNYIELYEFLRKQNEWHKYSDRVWVQHIDRINKCTMFTYQKIEIDNCEQKNPFLCEIDPKILIDPLSWRGDVVTIAVVGSLVLAFLLVALVIGCWYSKSRHRHVQRLERRNSIRQSLHSLRSVGSSQGFAEFGYRRKPGQMSTRSTDTLTKNSDYKKMVSNGSIDSMDKSAFNSSIEDNQSYDIYEAHNPNPVGFSNYSTPSEYTNPLPKARQVNPYATANTYDLAFKNEGFRDNSTFASRNNSNFQSRAESVQENTTSEETPIIHSQEGAYGGFPASDYYNTDTLPLSSSMGKSDSTLDLKRELDETMSEGSQYGAAYVPNKPKMSFLKELKSKIPGYENQENYPMKPTSFGQKEELPPSPPLPPSHNEIGLPYLPTYEEKVDNMQFSPDPYDASPPDPYYSQDRPKSSTLLETDLDNRNIAPKMPKSKSKSEALLETNFDYSDPSQTTPPMGQPISDANRSRSQPLETAM